MAHLRTIRPSQKVNRLLLAALDAKDNYTSAWTEQDFEPLAPRLAAWYKEQDEVRAAYAYDAVALRKSIEAAIASTRTSLRGEAP